MNEKNNRYYIRYIFLIILAVLPYYKFFHDDDYCFGDADLVVIGIYFVVFLIPFWVIFFYNLYKVSIKKESINIVLVIIFISNVSALYIALKYHNENVFKTKVHEVVQDEQDYVLELCLFDDSTFEYRKISDKISCYFIGNYTVKNDSIYLAFFNENTKSLKERFLYQKKDTLKSTIKIKSK